MGIFYLVGGFVISFVAGLIFTPLVSRLAVRMKWLDFPDGGRKVHKSPTPRVGGLAILGAFACGITFFFFAGDQVFESYGILSLMPSLPLILGGIAIVLVGLHDDAYNMGFKRKFIFQFIISYMMFVAGFRIDVSALSFLTTDSYLLASLSLMLTLLWYVGVMNAVNLIDGLDGLAGGISMIAFGTLTLILAIQGDFGSLFTVLAIMGAIAAFLVYNFNPASIFLGDSGSLFIGFMLATYALDGANNADMEVALLVISFAVGFPILDTSVAYVRRILAGRSPFSADRDHIHHRLVERFQLSTRKAVLSLYVLNGVLGSSAIALILVDTIELRVAIVLFTVVLLGAMLWRMGYLQTEVHSASIQPSPVAPQERGIEAVSAKPAIVPHIDMGTRQPTKAEILKMMSHWSEAQIISWWKKVNDQSKVNATSQHTSMSDVDDDLWQGEEFWTLERV